VRRFERFFFAPATPTNLGVIRAGLFSAAAAFALQENVTADAITARIDWRPVSYFHLLPGPPTSGTLRALQFALVPTAILAAAGLFTRVAQPAATLLAAYVLGFDSNFGKINHRSMLLVLLLFALLPAGTGDGVSIDRLVAAARTRNGDPVRPHSRYRWPVALAQLTAVSVYLFAGLSKLWNGGLGWFSADAFRRFLYLRLDQMPNPPRAGLWVADHPAVAQAAAIASVAFELSVALVLVWPALKKVVLPGIVVFHEATRRLVRIDFTRTMLCALIPLVDYEKLGRLVKAKASRPPAVLLMDGACPLCRRTAAVLKAADALGRLDVQDARDPDVLRRFPNIDPARALDEMHLVEADGRTHAGYAAYRRMSRMLPAAWPLAIGFHTPGVAPLGRRVYARVARSRLPVLHCTSASCSIDAPPARPHAQDATATRRSERT
jgi:predicted DCC family thiol-disulfide oxidoreductase YuxK